MAARGYEFYLRVFNSTCFPCWKSNQVTLFWRELFRVRSCFKGLKLSKLLFACLIMGSKPRLFCADQPRLFPPCFTNSRKYMYLLILNVMGLYRTLSYVEGYFRDQLKLKYVKLWSFYLAITLRWCSRTSLFFAFSIDPYAIASFNGRIISTSNLEVLGPAKTEIQTIARMFENRFPVSSSRAIRQLSPLLASVLIDVCFHIAASDWIMLQEENSSCKFGALQVIKVVRARSIQREASERL